MKQLLKYSDIHNNVDYRDDILCPYEKSNVPCCQNSHEDGQNGMKVKRDNLHGQLSKYIIKLISCTVYIGFQSLRLISVFTKTASI